MCFPGEVLLSMTREACTAFPSLPTAATALVIAAPSLSSFSPAESVSSADSRASQTRMSPARNSPRISPAVLDAAAERDRIRPGLEYACCFPEADSADPDARCQGTLCFWPPLRSGKFNTYHEAVSNWHFPCWSCADSHLLQVHKDCIDVRLIRSHFLPGVDSLMIVR